MFFFYVLHFLLRSISIYQTTDGKRDSHSLLLKSSSVCAQRKLTVDRLHFFFSPLYQAELQEVVGEEEAEDVSSTSSAPAESSKGETPESPAAQVQYTSAKLETDTINMFVKWEIFFACCQ